MERNAVSRALAKREKTGPVLPAIVAAAGTKAGKRFVEFFTATIRNKNTRAAYAHAVSRFLEWCEGFGLTLETIEPVAVAAYVEQLTATHSAPTVKQHLAAIRQLFDWLVTGQVVEVNPAASVKGPKHVVKKGKTPVLSAEDTRALLDSIETEREEEDGTRTPDIVGLRDRALIAVMFFSWARTSAVVRMKVEDYYSTNGKRWWFRFREKGGKFHEVPAHHTAEEYLDAYIAAAGIADEKKEPLFRTAPRTTRSLTEKPLTRRNALHLVKRRAKAAGLSGVVTCHTWRATGITVYLQNGGTIEKAQAIAGHESPKTTKLYDRTKEEITLDEIERIRI
jgi:site-specific recombinase XerD